MPTVYHVHNIICTNSTSEWDGNCVFQVFRLNAEIKMLIKMSQGIKVGRLHRLDTMNVSIEFHGNSSVCTKVVAQADI